MNRLPLIYLNDMGPTPGEFEFLDNMHEYPPDTVFGPGDLALLKEIPPRLLSLSAIPRVWQVRFVISLYQNAMHWLLHDNPHIGFDMAHAMLDEHGIQPRHYRKPLVYAHAFPHGVYPNSTEWFPERTLKRFVIQSPTEGWEHVLDEFQAPFHGYDPKKLRAGFVFDMAPDRYSDSRRLDHPLSFEEPSFHTACLLGLEHNMMIPAEAEALDPEHDVFHDSKKGSR